MLSRLPPSLVVFVLAAAVRLLYLAESRDYPAWSFPIIDAAAMHHFADQWVTEGRRNSTMAWHAPLYPMFLAAIYQILGVSIAAAKTVQALLGALHCAAIAALAGRMFGRRAAWAAGLFAAFYGPLIYYDGELVSAMLSVTWTLGLVAWTLHLPRDRGVPWALLGGALLGLGALTRGELLPALAAAMIWAVAGIPARPPVRALRLVLIAAAALAVLLPPAWMNRTFHGRLVLLPGNAGLNLYLGNQPDLCATLTARPGPDYDAIIRQPALLGLTDPRAKEAWFRHEAMRFALEHPWTAARHLLWKTGVHVNSREISSNTDLYTAREWSTVLSALIWRIGPFGFPFGVLWLLAAAALIRNPRALPGPVVVFLLMHAAVLIITHPSCRYRVPLVVVLLLLTGPGIAALTGWVREFAHARSRRALIAVGLFGAVSTLPLTTCLETIPFKAELFRLVGRYPQDPSTMRAWFEQARALEPDDPQVYYDLGRLALQENDEATALAHFTEALRLEPDYPEAMVHVAWLQREHPEIAIGLLQAALQRNPEDAEAHAELARLLAGQGSYVQAAAHSAAAIRHRSWDPLLHLNHAALLLEAGDPFAARRQLESIAAAWPPDDPRFAWNTGVASLQLGDRMAAAQYFKLVLRIDPGNQEAADALNRIERAFTTPGGDDQGRSIEMR